LANKQKILESYKEFYDSIKEVGIKTKRKYGDVPEFDFGL